MRNTHIMLFAFLLFNCADNNIAPVPPNHDAASKLKTAPHIQWTFPAPWSGYSYSKSLQDANIFLTLTWEEYGNPEYGWPLDPRRWAFYIITDGTALVDNPVNSGFIKEDYVDATYVFMIQLISSTKREEFKAGDYETFSDYLHPDGEHFITTGPMGFFMWLEGSREDVYHPSFHNANPYDPGVPIKISGSPKPNGRMTVEFTGTFMIFPYYDTFWNFYPGSFSYTGKVIDVTDKTPSPTPEGRVSSQNKKASIMKHLKRR